MQRTLLTLKGGTFSSPSPRRGEAGAKWRSPARRCAGSGNIGRASSNAPCRWEGVPGSGLVFADVVGGRSKRKRSPAIQEICETADCRPSGFHDCVTRVRRYCWRRASTRRSCSERLAIERQHHARHLQPCPAGLQDDARATAGPVYRGKLVRALAHGTLAFLL